VSKNGKSMMGDISNEEVSKDGALLWSSIMEPLRKSDILFTLRVKLSRLARLSTIASSTSKINAGKWRRIR